MTENRPPLSGLIAKCAHPDSVLRLPFNSKTRSEPASNDTPEFRHSCETGVTCLRGSDLE
jgi:hypothetical protein